MPRIYFPYLLYLALAAIAGVLLRGEFLLPVLILLGGLAIKTWVGQQRQRSTALGSDGSTISRETRSESGEPQE